MLEYLEFFQNHRRRQTSIGMLTPIEHESIHHQTTVVG